jgi:hypothetical protein
MNLNVSPLEAYLSNVPSIPFYLSNIVAIYTILQKQYQQELQRVQRPTSGGVPRSSAEGGNKVVAYSNIHSVVSEVISADSTPQDFHAAEAQAREILVYSILVHESCCEAVSVGNGGVGTIGMGVTSTVVGGGTMESLERGMRGLMMGTSMGLEDDNGLGLLSSSPVSTSSKGSVVSSKVMRMKEGILEEVGYFLSKVIGVLRSYTDDIRHPSVMRLQDEVNYYLQSIEHCQGSGSVENDLIYSRGDSSSYDQYDSGRSTETYQDDYANQHPAPSSEQLPAWSRPLQRNASSSMFSVRNTENDSQRRQHYPPSNSPDRPPSRNYPHPHHQQQPQYQHNERYDYRRPYHTQAPPRPTNPYQSRQQGTPYSNSPRSHHNPPRYSLPPPSRYYPAPPPQPPPQLTNYSSYGSQQHPRHPPRHQNYSSYSSYQQQGSAE